MFGSFGGDSELMLHTRRARLEESASSAMSPTREQGYGATNPGLPSVSHGLEKAWYDRILDHVLLLLLAFNLIVQLCDSCRVSNTLVCLYCTGLQLLGRTPNNSWENWPGANSLES
jgi:hypothetical protein